MKVVRLGNLVFYKSHQVPINTDKYKTKITEA